MPLVNAEPGTISWFAIQEGPSRFTIFDTFGDEAGRDAHLTGKVTAALTSVELRLAPSSSQRKKERRCQLNRQPPKSKAARLRKSNTNITASASVFYFRRPSKNLKAGSLQVFADD